MYRMDGRIAVITGGAPGIGAETARLFREAGATTITCNVSDPADVKVDVTDNVAVRKAVTDLVAKHRRIDVLVNNTGILRDAQLVRVKDDSVFGGMSRRTSTPSST